MSGLIKLLAPLFIRDKFFVNLVLVLKKVKLELLILRYQLLAVAKYLRLDLNRQYFVQVRLGGGHLLVDHGQVLRQLHQLIYIILLPSKLPI